MKVTSSETIHFPELSWGITAGQERELPIDKDAQMAILAHPSIKEAGKSVAADKEAKPKK